MKKLIFFFLFLISQHLVRGQNTTCPEKFKAYNPSGQEVTKFCVGQPIRFRSCLPNTQPDKEYYDFDKSNGVTFGTDTTKTITYTRPGTYTVTQLINTGVISQPERTFVVVDTPPPAFTVISCAQNTVKVTLTDKIYDTYQVDFNDGTKQSLSRGVTVSHTYTTGGPYKINVTGGFAGTTCTGQAENLVMPLAAPTAPALENMRVTRAGTSGSLSFTIKNLQSDYYYLIERIAGSTTTLVDTLKNPATATREYALNSINTSNPACFRVRITDKCGTNLNLNAGNICSQPLTASNGNNAINLAWPAYPEPDNVVNYELRRNGTLLQTLPASTTAFTDNQVQCNQKYCYGLKVNLKNNGSSVSSDTCLIAVTDINPPAGALSSTFTAGNQVELTFTPPGNITPTRTTYQKSTGNAAFATLTTTDKLNLTDNSPGLNTANFCYQAFYEDACGKTAAASKATCPVLLRAILNPDGTVSLNWTAYVGFTPNTINYAVERTDVAGTVISSTPVTGTSFSERVSNTDQQLIYRIKVTTANPAEVSFSNTQSLRQESSFQIPTAFSPNGDNLNDRFEIKGKIFGNFSLVIYDRWGQAIFRSNNQARGWDGTINGHEAPVGVYAYAFTATDTSGQKIVKNGTVTLVR